MRTPPLCRWLRLHGTEIELGVLKEAPRRIRKRGAKLFPPVVSDFVKGSCQNTKKIYLHYFGEYAAFNQQLPKRNGRDAGFAVA
ncbi:MAG: hypothetical protein ACLR23_20370 [Clostridia bacterium]